MSTREEILAEREKLRATYGSLFDDIAQILFAYDPAGVNYGTPTSTSPRLNRSFRGCTTVHTSMARAAWCAK